MKMRDHILLNKKNVFTTNATSPTSPPPPSPPPTPQQETLLYKVYTHMPHIHKQQQPKQNTTHTCIHIYTAQHLHIHTNIHT